MAHPQTTATTTWIDIDTNQVCTCSTQIAVIAVYCTNVSQSLTGRSMQKKWQEGHFKPKVTTGKQKKSHQ
jgi:hypothetical protein